MYIRVNFEDLFDQDGRLIRNGEIVGVNTTVADCQAFPDGKVEFVLNRSAIIGPTSENEGWVEVEVVSNSDKNSCVRTISKYVPYMWGNGEPPKTLRIPNEMIRAEI